MHITLYSCITHFACIMNRNELDPIPLQRNLYQVSIPIVHFELYYYIYYHYYFLHHMYMHDHQIEIDVHYFHANYVMCLC